MSKVAEDVVDFPPYAFAPFQETIYEPLVIPQPSPTTGACCEDDGEGGFICEDLSESECDEAGGSFKGTDTACDDDPSPCEQIGACCCVDDTGFVSCDTAIDSLCVDDVGLTCTWVTEEITCFHNRVCPDLFGAGGCCFSDSSCFTYVDEASCMAAGGSSWLGAGVMCWEVACP